ncbi:hypothetical protein [Clostridium pasteurianum]|uniref:hypothetical protein n=1 Tax=Clostridium pasteurianum TaxID=1501 RepID=UPI0015865CFF|nr:hypothetical protein [Clostridium pasteurianum]
MEFQVLVVLEFKEKLRIKKEELRINDDFPSLCFGKSTFYKRTFPLVEMEEIIRLRVFHSETEKKLQ